MRPSVALAAAVSCGVLAVALVGIDLALNVTAVLEVRTSSGWQEVASSGAGSPRVAVPYGASVCGREFRLTVHNGLMWPTQRHITVHAYGAGNPATLADSGWSLAAGETRSYEFTVPNATFAPPPGGAPGLKPSASLDVRIGDEGLYAAACQEASA